MSRFLPRIRQGMSNPGGSRGHLRGLGLAAAPHGRFVLSGLSRLEIISRRFGPADVLISTK